MNPDVGGTSPHIPIRRLAVAGCLGLSLMASLGQTNLTFTPLYSFDGTNGQSPLNTLVQGTNGDLYGTSFNGGVGFVPGYVGGAGTVFERTTGGALVWSFDFPASILDGSLYHTIQGAWPNSLVLGTNGNFYGTTDIGGSYGSPPPYDNEDFGSVFEMAPDGRLVSAPFFSFDGTNGKAPGSLMQAKDGNFYGTTYYGGASYVTASPGYGTIFKMSPAGSLVWSFSFTNGNGAYPVGGLAQGKDGNLYGATEAGGVRTYSYGTVFRISPGGTFKSLYTFTNHNDGGEPYGGVIQGRDGFLYGTTLSGGSNSWGTVFKMTTNGTIAWSAALDSTNGATPYAGLVQGSNGLFYGVAKQGGPQGSDAFGSGNGTIFQATTNGVISVVYSFTGGADGMNPKTTLMQASDGDFYGATTGFVTTDTTATNTYGSVFKFSLGASAQAPQLLFTPPTPGSATLTISWPDAATGFTLETNADLSQVSGWQPFGGTVIDTNGQQSAQINTATGSSFFRLRHP